MTDYLDGGGSLYIEGSDIGYNHHTTAFFDYLGTNYISNGSENGIQNIIGVENTFTARDDFAFQYNEDPDYLVDVLSADEGILYFTCQNEMGRSVFYDEGSYRVICSSSIFGAMADAEGINTKADLMARYFSFLTIDYYPHIWASSSELDFGIQYLNYPETKTINIRNIGYYDLNISFIGIGEYGFSYSGPSTFDLGWGEQIVLEISFISEFIGDYSAVLSINSNDPVLNPLLILLTGECISPPEIELSADSFIVELEQNSVIEETLTLSNVGESNLSYVININDLSLPTKSSGGPDDFGYRWKDSNEPDGPIYNWRDISTLGALVNFSHNDVGTEMIPIGFDFNFYGSNYSEFRINPNGWIGFGDDWIDYHNYELPRFNAPRPAIFGFWDDLDPLQGGDVYYHSTSDSLIIWFDNVIHYPGMYNGTYDFQIILYATGQILLQYRQVSGDIDTATIGIQNEDASDGLQVIYDVPYVENELATLFYAGTNWLEISSCAGTIPVDSFDDITLTFDATNLLNGTYQAEVVIVSNDPVESVIVIPITMIVDLVSANENLLAVQNKLLGNYPNPFNPTTTILFLTAKITKNTKIEIFNIKGQMIKKLEIKNVKLGINEVIWDGKDDNNRPISSGIYFYQLKTGNDFFETKRMLLLK
ncbi:MAG: T9SS type A sorting domain-containing protein [Candidatus Cloacimonetes bacterium]|nr:T9SS type A sorting domain-containing protein [Candidatus Cloacimonadota bacterium]